MQLIIRPVTTVDASDLGLEPGRWPLVVKYEGWVWGRPEWKRSMDGELLHVTYHCNGRKLVVCND